MKPPALLRALVVDDNALDAQLVMREIQELGEGTPVGTLDELRNALREPPRWDVILTDHAMPHMDTFTVLREAAEANVDAPVIIVSGQIGEQTLARAMVEGAADYVSKSRLQMLKPAVIRNVRARENARERARLERDRELFFDLSLDLFAITDLSGRFRVMNRAWTETLGIPEAHLRQHGLRGHVHPDDRAKVKQGMQQLVDGRPLRDLEMRVVARSDAAVPLLLNATPRLSEGTLYVVARDMTAQRLAEQALRRQERLASMGILVAGVAHELNNPLMYIFGSLDLARVALASVADAPETSPALRDTLESVENALATADRGARRIQALASQLAIVLRPARAETAPFDVNEGVNRAVQATKADGARVALQTDLRATTRALGRGIEIEQAVAWILRNAYEAALRGPGPATTRVQTRDEPDSVGIAITDNGPGIAPADAAKVFTPFFTTKADGAGLALAASHSIVTSLGGKLEFASAPGGGTTFTITLPRAG